MARFLDQSASRFVDGKKVGEGSIPMTQAMVFSADDGCDFGRGQRRPVSPDYGSRGNAFNGRVKGLQPSRLAPYSLP
ncbi:MAG: hypothetical protein JO151_18220 [Verrucomicrobia bacterium]|nr:hypothetical protein [Verrucomicrobiota bacterium]